MYYLAAFFSSCHFKIHVSKMIFITKNICNDSKTFLFLNQAHRYTGNWSFHRDSCIHES